MIFHFKIWGATFNVFASDLRHLSGWHCSILRRSRQEHVRLEEFLWFLSVTSCNKRVFAVQVPRVRHVYCWSSYLLYWPWWTQCNLKELLLLCRWILWSPRSKIFVFCSELLQIALFCRQHWKSTGLCLGSAIFHICVSVFKCGSFSWCCSCCFGKAKACTVLNLLIGILCEAWGPDSVSRLWPVHCRLHVHSCTHFPVERY